MEKFISIDATDTAAGMGVYVRTGKTLVYTAKVDLFPWYSEPKTLKITRHERKQVSGDRVRGIRPWQAGSLVSIKIPIDQGGNTMDKLYRIQSISENNELELEPVSTYIADDVEIEG